MDLEGVVAVRPRHVDIAAGVHGDSLGSSQRVPGPVARRVDDLGDRAGGATRAASARGSDPKGVVALKSPCLLYTSPSPRD